MGDRQSVEALQWLVYIGLTRNNIVHAGNGREVHLDRVPHVKVDGNCRETSEVFDYLPACLIAIRPLAKRLKRCRAGMRKPWQDCKRSKLQVIMFRSGVASLENCYSKIQALRKNLARTPM